MGAKQTRRQKSSKPSIYSRQGKGRKRTWEFVYRDSDGKQRWVGGFDTQGAAEDARGEVMRRIRRGERVAPDRRTFAEFAIEWLESQSQIRPATRLRYTWALERHLIPRFGAFKVGEITTDHVALYVADLQRGNYAGSTIKSLLNPLGLVLARAVRRGTIATNPVAALERSERPRGARREMRILDRGEIGRVLDATPAEHRPLIATLVFCGLRISESLGLVWADVDLEAGVLHVRRQLDDVTGERVEPKTENAKRSVVLMPALARVLAEHRIGSKFSRPTDPVFGTGLGTTLNRHNVAARVFKPAVKRAALDGDGRPALRLHDLRHGFASLLIANGASVVFVSRQLGHASPAMTLSTYSHLFDQRDHAEKMSTMMEASFGNIVETGTRNDPQSDADPEPAEVASLRPA